MTVGELKQYRSLKEELEELRDKIKEITTHDVVKASSKEFPYISHSVKVEGLDSTNLQGMRYTAELDRVYATIVHIEAWINGIEDSEIRRIFRFRYIEGERLCSWKRVARMLGVSGDGSTERKKHDRYMENFT